MKITWAVVVIAGALWLAAPQAIGHATSTGAAGPPSIEMQECVGENILAPYIVWEPGTAGQQWLDLSLFDNGFAPGTFLAAGPFAADRSAYGWVNLLPNTRHYARVNTLTPTGWQVGPTSSFTTGDCRRPSPAALGEVTQECDGGTVVGTFAWTVAVPVLYQQWLDISTQDNGFAPGTFISSGPIDSPYEDAFRWSGLRSYTWHYWRVNSWTGTAWVTSATGRFLTRYASPGGACYIIV